jgi:putative phosphotransacetylase
MKVKVGISNAHAHLTQAQIETLFGEGFALTFCRNIRQKDEFVSHQAVDVKGPKGTLARVRILGPARAAAQVELSLTNARRLGLDAEVRLSSDVAGTPGATLIGPKGEVVMEQGVVAAARHLHISPAEAASAGLVEGSRVCAEAFGVRGLVFRNIVVRVDELYSAELHLDTDEANAAGLKHGDEVELVLV